MIRVATVPAVLCLAGLLVASPTWAGAVALWAVQGDGTAVPAAKARASLQRRVPTAEPVDPSAPHGDPDALRYLVAGPLDALPSTLTVTSLDEAEEVVDTLRELGLTTVPCPKDVASETTRCAVTAPVRLVADDVDRLHPLVRGRSLRGRLGGRVVVTAAGHALGAVPILGPRATPVGPIDRMRAQLRVLLVRLTSEGAMPLGADLASARALAEAAVDRAGALWGACGVDFGAAREVAVEVVAPPPPALLAIGCGQGFDASGGHVSFNVDGRPVQISVPSGASPAQAARLVAAKLRGRGWRVAVFDNPRTASSAGGSTDLLVRRRTGELATLGRTKGPLTDDATLGVCIGHVNLEDGLQHFGDVNAAVGTLEERTLLRSLDDEDPSTIDVVLLPAFARGGRIGESFIGSDGGTLRNLVVVDRAGLLGGQASFTLAHELGHVLLDDPGHPDDFGKDLPWRLMDADAADPSAFGPRRLSVAECARVITQSGPEAPVPLVTPWP